MKINKNQRKSTIIHESHSKSTKVDPNLQKSTNQNPPKNNLNQLKSIKIKKTLKSTKTIQNQSQSTKIDDQNQPKSTKTTLQNAPRAPKILAGPPKIIQFLLHSQGLAGVAAGVVSPTTPSRTTMSDECDESLSSNLKSPGPPHIPPGASMRWP